MPPLEVRGAAVVVLEQHICLQPHQEGLPPSREALGDDVLAVRALVVERYNLVRFTSPVSDGVDHHETVVLPLDEREEAGLPVAWPALPVRLVRDGAPHL